MKWSFVSLGDVLQSAEVFVDGDWVESKDQDINGDVRLIQLADIGDGYYIDKSSRFLTSDKAQELRCTFLEKGDVLVARMPEPLGRACIFLGDSKRSVTVVDICIIRPNRQHNDARWLMHCLNAPVCRNQMADFATGSTRTRISRGNLTKIKIPLPPIEEQKRIAEILDRTQSLISKRKEAIELLDTLTQSIFIEMFGDPFTNPKGWEVNEFSSQIKSVRYGTGSPPIYTDEGIPFIRATNVKEGIIKSKDMKRISQEEANKIAKCQIRFGDLIVVRSGVNTGDCAMILREYDRAYAAFDLIVELPLANSIFYNFLINSPYGKICLAPLTRRAAQPHLNAEQLKSLRFIAPPVPIKEEFAQRIEAVEKLKATHRASLTELQALFASLQHRAFRGEL